MRSSMHQSFSSKLLFVWILLLNLDSNNVITVIIFIITLSVLTLSVL